MKAVLSALPTMILSFYTKLISKGLLVRSELQGIPSHKGSQQAAAADPDRRDNECHDP